MNHDQIHAPDQILNTLLQVFPDLRPYLNSAPLPESRVHSDGLLAVASGVSPLHALLVTCPGGLYPSCLSSSSPATSSLTDLQRLQGTLPMAASRNPNSAGVQIGDCSGSVSGVSMPLIHPPASSLPSARTARRSDAPLPRNPSHGDLMKAAAAASQTLPRPAPLETSIREDIRRLPLPPVPTSTSVAPLLPSSSIDFCSDSHAAVLPGQAAASANMDPGLPLFFGSVPCTEYAGSSSTLPASGPPRFRSAEPSSTRNPAGESQPGLDKCHPAISSAAGVPSYVSGLQGTILPSNSPLHDFVEAPHAHKGDYHCVQMNERVLQVRIQSLLHTFIGRVTYVRNDKPRNVDELCLKLRDIWAVKGDLQVIPLGKGYYNINLTYGLI